MATGIILYRRHARASPYALTLDEFGSDQTAAPPPGALALSIGWEAYQRRDAERSGTMAEADVAAPRHRHQDMRSASDRRNGGTKMPVRNADQVMQRRHATLRCPLKNA